MYRFEVHANGENGYCPVIGYVEVKILDYGDATELAKYAANTGQFDTKHNEYSESDIAYVIPG